MNVFNKQLTHAGRVINMETHIHIYSCMFMFMCIKIFNTKYAAFMLLMFAVEYFAGYFIIFLKETFFVVVFALFL